jgi:hypothetical protein
VLDNASTFINIFIFNNLTMELSRANGGIAGPSLAL